MLGRVLVIAMPIILLVGCAGSSARRLPPEQMIAPPQAKSKEMESQGRILAEASRATLTSYKDYKVGPEDLLEVSFLANDELGREVRVNGRGEIALPLVGPVQVTGLSPQEVEKRLVQLYKDGKFLRNPQITVAVKEYRYQRVMVTGAVTNPGSYEMIGPRTFLEMLGKAGGLSDKPEMKAGDVAYVIRHQSASALMKVAASQPFTPGAETMVIDLRRLLAGGEMSLNVPINSGDVIYVPPARMAFVLGAVKKPGQVAVKNNLTATQAVALAEGQDPILASNNISIVRFDETGQRIVIPVNLKGVTTGAETDPLLKENDIVFVKESGVRRLLWDIRNFVPVGASVPMMY